MIYAIDFGTSNSLLGAASDGKTLHTPIPLDLDAKDATILRSVMFFAERGGDSESPGGAYFGTRAIEEYVRHGQDERGGRLIRSVKKFLPQRSFNGTLIGNKNVSLEEIISTFLGEMRKRANAHFNQDVTRAVIGRPVRFSEEADLDKLAQDRLEKAARLAGFREIHFYPEPIAAAYEFKSTLREPKLVLVADFGGGTSDFTVIRLTPGAQAFSDADILATGGVSVAGDALDASIMRKRIARHFGSEVQYKVPFGSNVLTMPINLMEKICSPADISMLRKKDTIEFFRNVQNWALGAGDREKMDHLFTLINEQIGFSLFEEIERTKRAIGEKGHDLFSFDYADIEIEDEISSKNFETFAAERIDDILSEIDETIAKAGLKHSDIDLICATGGTAKVPALSRGLAERFGKENIQQHNHFHSITQGLIRFAGDLA